MFYNGYLRGWLNELRDLSDDLEDMMRENEEALRSTSDSLHKTLTAIHAQNNDMSNLSGSFQQESRRLIRKRLSVSQQQKLRQAKDGLFNVAIQMLDYLDRELLRAPSSSADQLLTMARSYIKSRSTSLSTEDAIELKAVLKYMYAFTQNHGEKSGSVVVSIGRLEAKRRSLRRGFPLDMLKYEATEVNATINELS